jgi:peptidoglycan/LPS O-acetylase OafA/YrhL
MEKLFNSVAESNTRFESRVFVDLLKGLAICQVVFFHAIIDFKEFLEEQNRTIFNVYVVVAQSFKFGPFVFFIISGFLMSKLYGTNLLKFKSQRRSFSSKEFFLKRFARIYPLWILFLLFTFFEFQIFDYGFFNNTIELLDEPNKFYVFLLGATFLYYFYSSITAYWLIPGGWSIVSEVTFYIIFPLIRRAKIETLLFISTILICLTYVLKYLVHSKYLLVADDGIARAIIYSGIETTFPYFLFGILINEVITNKIRLKTLISRKQLIFNASSLLLVLIVCPSISGQNASAIMLIIATLVFGILAMNVSKLMRIFSILGVHSYFIYFFHFHVIAMVKHIFANNYSVFDNNAINNLIYIFIFPTLVLSFSLIVAKFSMRFFEKPLQKLILTRISYK